MSELRSITDFPLVKQRYKSRPEGDFGRWLLSRFPHALVNSRVHIAPKELDFVLEPEGVAIEFNGDYWHSDAHLLASKGCTAREQHEQKLQLASEAGLRLLFVWESDWRKHREAVSAAVVEAAGGKKAPRILTKLTRNRPSSSSAPTERRKPVLDSVVSHGAIVVSHPSADSFNYALASEATKRGLSLVLNYPWTDGGWLKRFVAPRSRVSEYSIAPVGAKPAREFYRANCFLGGHRSTTDSLGAFVHGELVACVSFNEKTGSIVRMGEKTGADATAALREIIATRLDGRPLKVMVDYSDNRLAPMLESLDFVELAPTGSSIMWYRDSDGKTAPSSSIQRLGADRLLGTSYGPREVCGLNNEGIMLAEGFVAYRTAGNRVFEWRATT